MLAVVGFLAALALNSWTKGSESKKRWEIADVKVLKGIVQAMSIEEIEAFAKAFRNYVAHEPGYGERKWYKAPAFAEFSEAFRGQGGWLKRRKWQKWLRIFEAEYRVWVPEMSEHEAVLFFKGAKECYDSGLLSNMEDVEATISDYTWEKTHTEETDGSSKR